MYVCGPINTVAAPAGCSCVSKQQSTKPATYTRQRAYICTFIYVYMYINIG